MKRHNYHNLVYFCLSIVWGAMIYYFSSIPDLKSGLDDYSDLIFRKAGHIFIYTILAYLLTKIFNKHQKPYLFFVAIVGIIYAMTDEVHQLAITHRSGNITDVLIDSLGVLLGILLFRFFRK